MTSQSPEIYYDHCFTTMTQGQFENMDGNKFFSGNFVTSISDLEFQLLSVYSNSGQQDSTIFGCICKPFGEMWASAS